MPDLSSGGLFWKRRGFDGVRPITFIFQTRLWNRKKAWPVEMKLHSPSYEIERCVLLPEAILSNALKSINEILLVIRTLASMLILYSSIMNV